MKILFFVAQFPCTSETFILNQITSLLDAGHDVRIYSWGNPDLSCVHKDIAKYDLLSRTMYKDINVPQSHAIRVLKFVPTIFRLFNRYGYRVFRLFYPKYGHPIMSRNLMQGYIAQRFLTLQWQPDAIVSHFGDTGIIVTALRNAGIVPEGIKCFTYFHAHDICRMNVKQVYTFYKPMFNKQDILLPINHLWKDLLIAAGADPTNVKVLRMGVDLEHFKYMNVNEIKDTINILSVGRLCGQKGFEYAIRGVAEYAKSAKKKISYRIIGCGELDKTLRALVNKLQASDYIHFLGAQPQHIVIEEMEKANVFILPSVTDNDGYMEGIPVALMESMAKGLCCISTYHSGIPELIKNGETGFLCKEKDFSDIAKVLEEIESLTSEQLDIVREKARNTIESEFDVVKECNKLQNLIEA